jgi:hypothetical protein
MNRKNSAIPVEKTFQKYKSFIFITDKIPNGIRIREISASNSQQDILAFEC